MIIPIGSSDGAIRKRQRISARRRRMEPKRVETGMRRLCFGPMRRRAKWGLIRPTKPMMPQKETTSAVKREAQKSRRSLVFRRFSPLEIAVLSSIRRRSIALALLIRRRREKRTAAAKA